MYANLFFANPTKVYHGLISFSTTLQSHCNMGAFRDDEFSYIVIYTVLFEISYVKLNVGGIVVLLTDFGLIS